MVALPATRDIDCAIRLSKSSGRFGHFLPIITRVDQLAVRWLNVFAEEPPVAVRDQRLEIPIDRLNPGHHYRQSQFGSFYTVQKVTGEERAVFSQHAPAESVWDIWFQHITVPTYFETAIYVPPVETADFPADGVVFRVYTQVRWTPEKKLVFEQHYDPRIHKQPIPVRISLEEYLNRRMILWIYLETDIAETPYYDRAVWIEPRIVLELSEEAARATYYPQR